MAWYKNATEYWGAKGSGYLFVCREDQTVLLFLRSMGVEQPGTWGVTGGAVKNDELDDSFYSSVDSTEVEIEEGQYESTAYDETTEETGGFPSSGEHLDHFDFVDGSFTFRTHVSDLTIEEKNEWTPQIILNWENDNFQWFPINSLPKNLHFGIIAKLEDIKRLLGEQTAQPNSSL